MTTTLIKVSFPYSRMSPAEFLVRTSGVYVGLNGNPDYTNTPVTMPDFKAGIDGFSAALTASFGGGSQAIAQRNILSESLWRTVRLLGRYVETTCKDDLRIFLSSGFQPAVNGRSSTLPLSEFIRRIDPGSVPGQFVITLVSVDGAGSYELRWAPVPVAGSPVAWTTRSVTNIRGIAIGDLTPGTVYTFQVRALTSTGFTSWGDPVTKMSL